MDQLERFLHRRSLGCSAAARCRLARARLIVVLLEMVEADPAQRIEVVGSSRSTIDHSSYALRALADLRNRAARAARALRRGSDAARVRAGTAAARRRAVPACDTRARAAGTRAMPGRARLPRSSAAGLRVRLFSLRWLTLRRIWSSERTCWSACVNHADAGPPFGASAGTCPTRRVARSSSPVATAAKPSDSAPPRTADRDYRARKRFGRRAHAALRDQRAPDEKPAPRASGYAAPARWPASRASSRRPSLEQLLDLVERTAAAPAAALPRAARCTCTHARAHQAVDDLARHRSAAAEIGRDLTDIALASRSPPALPTRPAQLERRASRFP